MYAPRRLATLLGSISVLLFACGESSDYEADERPTVVVTHSILGDVVDRLGGDQVDVITVMGPGADPHDFSASARDVDTMQRADALIVNGGDFEAGLLDVIDGARADGVATFEALSAVSTLEQDDGDGRADPHFFTDPTRVAEAVDGIIEFLVEEIDGLDAEALLAAGTAYREDLENLDVEIEGLLAAVPTEDRVLVTNHEVFGYLADHYGFDVIGTVLPGASTDGAASASELDELADTISDAGVAAIFVEQSASSDLADTVAAEAGSVSVVTLFSESLGGPDSGGGTYVEMMRTNAQRIAAALAPDAT